MPVIDDLVDACREANVPKCFGLLQSNPDLDVEEIGGRLSYML